MATPQDEEQTSPTGTPNTSLLDSRIKKELDDRGIIGGGSHGGSGGGLSDRLSRLEGAFDQALEGIRHGQNLMLGLIGIGFALVIAVLVYVVQRIDTLPNDFLSMNQTLSGAISASKQQPAQVILLPTPSSLQSAQAPPKKP